MKLKDFIGIIDLKTIVIQVWEDDNERAFTNTLEDYERCRNYNVDDIGITGNERIVITLIE